MMTFAVASACFFVFRAVMLSGMPLLYRYHPPCTAGRFCMEYHNAS
jgi:hypothetical protein